MAYVMVFSMFNELRQELIVHFVDIGGIVDHHCLSFLFICYLQHAVLQTCGDVQEA
jgi:hypothetical protein